MLNYSLTKVYCLFSINFIISLISGILYSNESLRNLLRDIKLEYSGIHYFITRRLNQDVLENLFSYLKGMNGANTHLSPLDFKHW